MTGEEHYREAEKLLDQVSATCREGWPLIHDFPVEGDPELMYAHSQLIARAGVHAQLAIAAVYVKAEAKS